MVVCKGVLQLAGTFPHAAATALHLPKGPGFLRTLCWEVFILIVKSIYICICDKGCVWLFAAMPVLTLFTFEGKPKLTHVLGFQLVYLNVLCFTV